MSEEFSSNLAKAIAASGMTQAEIAKAVGITAPYLSDLKKGNKANPSREVLVKLSECLGISVSELFSSESGVIAEDHSVVREDVVPYRFTRKPALNNDQYAALLDSILPSLDVSGLIEIVRVLNEQQPPGWEALYSKAIARLGSNLPQQSKS